jgi:Ca-activated chloride channel family protein
VTLALSFRAPAWWWLLLAVAALAAVYVLLQRRKPTYTARFTNLALLEAVAPKRPGWRRHLPAAVFALALVPLVGALAGPRHETKVARNRATIVLAIDTSLSMQATDAKPNRLAAAKKAADEFLSAVPGDVNVGLVSFNGTATIQVTPTTDRSTLRTKIDGLHLGESTAIGEAIFASLSALDTVPAPRKGQKVPARIILLSDGSTTVGRSNDAAAAAAKKQGVPVDTIAFGQLGTTITLPPDPTPIDVSVDRDALKKIADETGGHAYTATSASQIRDVYRGLAKAVGYDTVVKDLTPWFVGAGLVLLGVAAALSLTWSNRML